MKTLMLSPAAAEEFALALENSQTMAAGGDPGAKWRGGSLKTENGIGIIDVSGAMVFDKSLLGNFMATIFGGTLTPELHASLKAAKADPGITGVLLKMNSPGGEVAGTEEAARLVRDLTGSKPVVALVESTAASAAYWVASGASQIIAQSRTAALGSIGVVATVRKQEKDGAKTYQIVSSQSPKKRPDLETEEGRNQMKGYVDSLAQVFIDSVATMRGKTAKQVESDFGQGDVLLADEALRVGMIDRIGSEADAIAALRGLATTKSSALDPGQRASAEDPGKTIEKGAVMEDTEKTAIRAEAVKAERERIAGILNLEEAKGREPLARQLALSTEIGPEAAKAILAAAPKADAFGRAMADLGNPEVQPGADDAPPQAEIDKEVKQILALSGNISKEDN